MGALPAQPEPWWSRGHASVAEGPGGDWWMVYHGYENGFRTLGRRTPLEPVEWTADGWFRAKAGDLSRPLPKIQHKVFGGFLSLKPGIYCAGRCAGRMSRFN